ncbi:MAG: 1-(5-phosphoribosyl)-5-[(5-phosphoribosylamino)methylideneamino]imidazole-4-carboxamide isomerase [Lachnospiraceae bacterium]|jgi:phosphoribosylformimino-5-aminoimidazole carboxamide ribotide isomerase
MRLYPAIDIKDGKCVRLRKGDFDQVTQYFEKPWEAAAAFEKAGASYIHNVDLDGARKGHSYNADAVREIVRTVSIPVELGGGIRTLRDIEEVLNQGVARVIIGTKAVEDPGFVRKAVETFGAERIAVGIDAKDGWVAVDAWEKTSDVTSLDLALQMKDLGVRTIIYTDISRDGMLTGPNVEATKLLTEKTGLDVIASGGVSGMEDLEHLQAAGICGAIIGKAIYEKKIDLAEAVRRFEQSQEK